MKKSSLVLAACALLVALGALAASLIYTPSVRMGEVVSSGQALVGGEFEATDHNGKRVTNKDFEGKYALFYFGFTYCPDICPAELQVISAALNEIPDASEKIRVIFVSIDPARDTPEVMKDYVANFWPGTVGLTGSEEDIRNVAGKFRVYYSKVAQDGDSTGDDYLMDHSSFVYLMDPDGKFVRHFAYGTPVDADGQGSEIRDEIIGASCF
jgi:cytochrome oxidase Cu insertion factor (SCO1/SenC/PrrC family)